MGGNIYMDTRTLDAFLSLAHYLNFTKSAEQLFISQPAFSRQITKLEEEFGCQLFFRNKRKVELTEYGLAFLEHAEKIAAEYSKWKVTLNHMQNQKSGHLRIGFLQDLPHEFLPLVTGTFTNRYDHIQLTYRDLGMSDIVDGLLRGELDFGFSLTGEHDYEEIHHLMVSHSALCAVLPVSHPLAGSPTIRLEELRDQPFVMLLPEINAPATRHINSLCSLAGFEPNITAYCSYVPSLLMLVKCGAGIALVAEHARATAPDGLVFIPIDHRAAVMRTQLLWKNTNRNPAVPLFLESARMLLENT